MQGLVDWSEWGEEPTIIQIHAIVAVLGLVLGAWVMLARKGSPRHKLMGRAFGVLALATAGTSFFINEIRLWGPFSYIHLLSILTIVLVWRGVVAIRAGRVQAHQRAMRFTFFGGFIIAGAFTMLEGRLTYEIFLERGLEGVFGSEFWPGRVMLGIAIFVTIVAVSVYLKGWRRVR